MPRPLSALKPTHWRAESTVSHWTHLDRHFAPTTSQSACPSRVRLGVWPIIENHGRCGVCVPGRDKNTASFRRLQVMHLAGDLHRQPRCVSDRGLSGFTLSRSLWMDSASTLRNDIGLASTGLRDKDTVGCWRVTSVNCLRDNNQLFKHL